MEASGFRRADPLLAGACGLLSPLAFAPWGLSLLMPLTAAGLFASWRMAASARRAALNGFLFGLGLFGSGVWWVYISLHRFGGMSASLAVVLVVLFVAFLALFPAAVGYLSARLLPRLGVGSALGMPALWVLGEWLRGRLLTGFPWLTFGYSQAGHVLGNLATYGGAYAVSFAVALVGSLIAWTLVEFRGTTMAAAAAAIVLLYLGVFALGSLSWIHPSGAGLRVALVQGNVSDSLKWRPGHLRRIIHRYLGLTRQVPAGTRVVIWPETAIPEYLSVLRPKVIPKLRRYAKTHDLDFLIGLIEDRGMRAYNAVADIRPGHRLRLYRKRHLVPFGEYLPWPHLLSPLLSYLQIPMSDLNAWHGREEPLPAGGQKLGVSVCYEDVFGRDIRRLLPAATILVNVSDDGWYGRSAARDQHLQIAQMRAIGAGRFMLSDTNDGVTAVIDERGRIVARIPSFRAGVLTATVQPLSGTTPYTRFGSSPIVALSILTVLGVRMSPFRRGRKPGRTGNLRPDT
ncbi:MAG: apolipoprotein N-acyltransferase [Acidiferrobacteraceae bacterium]